MRPIFSPTEYIQIKGRGTRRFTFVVGNTEYEKKHFFLLDFCAVAAYFEEKYDYAAPLKVPQHDGRRGAPARYEPGDGCSAVREPGATYGPDEGGEERREIPVWEGTDRIVSQEIRIVGPNGEKVDVMTFRGSFERDLKEFAEADPDLQSAVESEDDDAIETILQQRFYHRPEMFYAPDKLIISYGVPAPTPAFVYNALGKRPLPTKDKVVADTVDSIAARFNLRYGDQKWLNATAELQAANIEKGYRRIFFGQWARYAWDNFVTLTGNELFDTLRGAIEKLHEPPSLSQTGKVLFPQRDAQDLRPPHAARRRPDHRRYGPRAPRGPRPQGRHVRVPAE
jgi:hypothetical protein